MTGFGRGKMEQDGRCYTIEIKSVNHKYNDISIRMPRFLNQFEDKIRKKIGDSIWRGKLDVFINFEDYSKQGNQIHFNIELAKEYVQGLENLAKQTGLPYNFDVMDIAKMPEILKVEEDENEDLIENELMLTLEMAIQNIVEMRQFEGQRLIKDIKQRILFVEKKLSEIEAYSGTLVKEYMEKLEQRIKELMDTKIVDENRLAQEIVIFSDKSSIEEEITRLHSHINQFKDFLSKGAW